MKSVFITITLFLFIQSIFALHQTQTAFLKENAHCYSVVQDRTLLNGKFVYMDQH